MNYIYDGTFEGLLTAIYEAFYSKETPVSILSSENLQHSLLETSIDIPTDAVKAQKVYNAIWRRISFECLQSVYYAFLSEENDIGTMIYRYLDFGFKNGPKIQQYLTDPRVSTINTLRYKVGHEVHRMIGFIRFSRYPGEVFYARIEPEYNILELVAPHFHERFPDHAWVIHDIGRKKAAVYDKTKWHIRTFDINPHEVDCVPEGDYERLWQHYFNTICIRERQNPSLQKRLMPVRYWKYMVEKRKPVKQV